MRRLAFVLLLICAACKEQGLSGQKGVLRLTPPAADFGRVFPFETKEQTVTLRNDGAPVHVTWSLPASPFSVEAEALPTEIPSGDVELTLRFTPDDVGRFTSELTVEADGLGSAQLLLLGEGKPPPSCSPARPCHAVAFDAAKGKCVETALADGTSCADSSACLIDPICMAGRCLGKEKSCDDGNACTTDTCHAETGCAHLPAPPCPGDGKCQVGTCDPTLGCTQQRAADGTPCGALQSCVAADVCIDGACVVRDPPDGYVCAQASPCQPAGTCIADVCERSNAGQLTPSWSYDALTATDAGVRTPPVHELFVEPGGEVTLSGAFSSTPQVRKNTAWVTPAVGLSSRCVQWGTRLVCSKPNDAVHAIDPATGATVWSFNLRTAKPEYKTQSLFVGRMAVQGTDRLATLWEAYPAKAECRIYFLAILDAAGALVMSAPVTDLTLNACNHPHAYGFAADARGDLYVAFAPTVTNPPLVSGMGTTLMAFTRDGVFRWRRADVMQKGGEIAVARGLLYAEHTNTALSTATGQPAFSIAEPFGRLLASRTRLMVAPIIGTSAVNGYEAGTSALKWTHTLAQGQTFASHETRLATWQTSTGPRTVALAFVKQNAQVSLHAIDVADGAAAFTCPVVKARRTDPQMFEVADGVLAVQDGASGCSKCEPSFADKPAAFHTLTVPTLSRALYEPWIGTYGGPGHDHREE